MKMYGEVEVTSALDGSEGRLNAQTPLFSGTKPHAHRITGCRHRNIISSKCAGYLRDPS